jgi:hypothetical protein
MQSVQSLNAPLVTTDATRRFILPGLIAGTSFLTFEMLVGALTTTAWSFPQSIVQTIGVGAPTAQLDLAQLLLGVAIHLAFSVGLGVLFVAITERFGLSGRRLLAAGVLYMWAESFISIWVVLHTLFPETLPILFAAVPFWASVVGRSGFGILLALTYVAQVLDYGGIHASDKRSFGG